MEFDSLNESRPPDQEAARAGLAKMHEELHPAALKLAELKMQERKTDESNKQSADSGPLEKPALPPLPPPWKPDPICGPFDPFCRKDPDPFPWEPKPKPAPKPAPGRPKRN